MADETEREDLESLIASPGWRRLVAHFNSVYDGQFLDHATKILSHDEDPGVLAKMRQLAAVRQAWGHIRSYPEDRVASVRRLEDTQAASRRGRGL